MLQQTVYKVHVDCLVAQLLHSLPAVWLCQSNPGWGYGHFCELKSCHLRHLIGPGAAKGGDSAHYTLCVTLRRVVAVFAGQHVSVYKPESCCGLLLWHQSTTGHLGGDCSKAVPSLLELREIAFLSLFIRDQQIVKGVQGLEFHTVIPGPCSFFFR